MLFWFAIFIGAAAALKTWGSYSDAKFERERKLAKIQLKLKQKEQEQSQD